MARASIGRRAALKLLGDIRRRDAHARDVLRSSTELAAIDVRERAFATRLVLGVIGARGFVDQTIDAYLSTRAHLEPRVRDALRISAFELLFCATPTAVAVSQGVELVRSVRPRAQGLANAVLRRVAENDAVARQESLGRMDAGHASVADLARASGYPQWLLEQVVRDRGAEAAGLLAASAAEPAPVYVAGNGALHTEEQTQELLAEAGLEPVPVGLTGAFALGRPQELAASGLVDKADVVVADLSAQRVALAADVLPGMRLLEVGQGRGTKSVLLQNAALRQGGPARVVGVDTVPYKVGVARRRMERARLSQDVACVELDARLLGSDDEPEAVRGCFDTVFVDAPCSGTGTLRRHPEICWNLSATDVTDLATLQYEILTAAAAKVREGGSLVYATCSLLLAENEGVVRTFLASETGAAFELCAEPLQTLVAPDGPDGHFCAKMRRREL